MFSVPAEAHITLLANESKKNRVLTSSGYQDSREMRSRVSWI